MKQALKGKLKFIASILVAVMFSTLLPLTVYAGEDEFPNGKGHEEHNFTAKGIEILTNPRGK